MRSPAQIGRLAYEDNLITRIADRVLDLIVPKAKVHAAGCLVKCSEGCYASGMCPACPNGHTAVRCYAVCMWCTSCGTWGYTGCGSCSISNSECSQYDHCGCS